MLRLARLPVAEGLDKAGSEAVGAVVVARYGSNPMDVINNVKDKIKEIEAGLPQKTLPDGTVSKVTIVPFYDRTGLIQGNHRHTRISPFARNPDQHHCHYYPGNEPEGIADCSRIIAYWRINDFYPDASFRH